LPKTHRALHKLLVF